MNETKVTSRFRTNFFFLIGLASTIKVQSDSNQSLRRISMKLIVRAFLTSVICLNFIPTALGRNPGAQPAATVAGVYANFTVGKASGDLEGMRVVIV